MSHTASPFSLSAFGVSTLKKKTAAWNLNITGAGAGAGTGTTCNLWLFVLGSNEGTDCGQENSIGTGLVFLFFFCFFSH